MPITASQPFTVDSNDNIKINIDDKTMAVKDNKLQAKQGVVVAGTATTITDSNISINIDGKTIVRDDDGNSKVNIEPQAPFAADNAHTMSLARDEVTTKLVGDSIVLNYEGQNGV